MLPPGTQTGPLEYIPDKPPGDLKLLSGVALSATLEFGAAAAGSLSSNLSMVSDSEPPKVQLVGSFTKASDSTTDVLFAASISFISLFSSHVQLKDVELTYRPIVPQQSATRKNAFSLSATCFIEFSEHSQWAIPGSLEVGESSAQFNFKLAAQKEPFTLSETLKLKFSDIELSGTYNFSPTPAEEKDATNQGVIRRNGRSAAFTVKLEAKTSIGGHVDADVSVIFVSGTPGVVTLSIPGQLNLGKLVSSLFEGDFPAEILDITFSKLFMYYAWKQVPATTSGTKSLSDRTYKAGFLGEASVDIYGVGFELGLSVASAEGKKGITIEGTKDKPVEVVCLVLHGKEEKDKGKGPKFGLSTVAGDKYCYVEGGITLFGTYVGSAKLSYHSGPKSPRFMGDVQPSFLQAPNNSISFELVKTDDKTRLRFTNLPAAFDDLIKAGDIIKKIGELSTADKSPCGVIKLAFGQLKTTVTVHAKLSDGQGGQSPGDGKPADVDSIKIDVDGTFDLQIEKTTVTGITFTFSELKVAIPKTLDFESVIKKLGESLVGGADDIITALWNQKEKLAAVIGLVAGKMTAEALASAVCRKIVKPKSTDGDKPNEDQEPDTDDNGGGPDGDGAGGTSLASGAGGAGALGTVASFFAWLFGALASLIPSPHSNDDKPDPPAPPRPDPLPTPPDDDPLAQVIYEALHKDFDKWKSCTNFNDALDAVLACALDYRRAIKVIRKVLGSKDTAKELGAKAYADYLKRRAVLVYDFSLLSKHFAERWLDMSDYEIEMKILPAEFTYSPRKLEIKWDTPRTAESLTTAITVYVNDTLTVKLKTSDTDTIVIDIPPFNLKENFQVTAKVTAVAAKWGGEPVYAFYSQGRPSTGVLEEVPPTVTTGDATRMPNPNNFLQYANLNPETGGPGDKTKYPILRVGAVTLWPLGYKGDPRSTIDLYAFNSTGDIVINDEFDGPQYIRAITVSGEKVHFEGTYGPQIPMAHDIRIWDVAVFQGFTALCSARVTTRDAGAQPSVPNDLFFNTPSKDLTKYPVFLYGTSTYWALSSNDSKLGVSILLYDSSKKVVKRWDNPNHEVKVVSSIVYKPENWEVSFVDPRGASAVFQLGDLVSPLVRRQVRRVVL
ncbi:hypothetical protein BOTBODRAFT_58709 [Botryobasidium botryosum FD-172 SS1]|uniref:Uncharacterized protein n=1 Tax=Botryobasidium botryosum (strain FD-172 SS1) TaxID=930990 RepID=A0A067MCR3_BOTB1|nr:hypothetical protein BOTBODRAFT_58709 [Botryobasidium botryosum FD-172 SS1]